MSEPQTDVSRPSALPTANLQRGISSQSIADQNSAEYLDEVEEEWNKKVDGEVETLVEGMVDLVGLASVRLVMKFCFPKADVGSKIGNKDKFRVAQEAFQIHSRAESMVCYFTRRYYYKYIPPPSYRSEQRIP